MTKSTVYIGLGSNLEDPIKQIKDAIAALAKLPHTTLIKTSSLYTSDSLLPDQPRYTNAVISIKTYLEPEALLDQLQTIENNHGRQRKQRWGARTLDLDIILYGNLQIDTPRLTIPHCQMHLRTFVLTPLTEIEPELKLPSGQAIASLLQNCPPLNLKKIIETSTLILEAN